MLISYYKSGENMETAEKTGSRVDSAVDVLSGKLKDLLAKKGNVVIQFENDCIVAAAAKDAVAFLLSSRNRANLQ